MQICYHVKKSKKVTNTKTKISSKPNKFLIPNLTKRIQMKELCFHCRVSLLQSCSASEMARYVTTKISSAQAILKVAGVPVNINVNKRTI